MKMRRKDREVTSPEEIRAIIDNCQVCRIAMEDLEGLYIVPLNFGYTYENNQLELYFHSAKQGRKINALRENSEVGFEMDCDHKLVTGEAACDYSYFFKSIIGKGQVSFIDDIEEKKEALSLLMKHQTREDFVFDDKMAATVEVFKIRASSFTGKVHS